MQKKMYDLWPNQMGICLSKIQLQTCVQQVGIRDHSIPITVSDWWLLKNIISLLVAFSVNRETQKGFNYSNNFRLQDPSVANKFVLCSYGWP